MQQTRTMKPILGISLFAVFSTVVLLLATFANTGAEIRLSSSPSQIEPGDDITASLVVSTGEAGVSAIDTTVTYDESKLTFKSFTADTSGGFNVTGTDSDGSVTIRGFQEDILSADGVTGEDLAIGEIVFTANNGSSGLANIGFSTAVFTDIEGPSDFEPTQTELSITIGSGGGGQDSAGGEDTSGGEDTAGADDGNGSGQSGSLTGSQSGSNSDGNGGGEEGGNPPPVEGLALSIIGNEAAWAPGQSREVTFAITTDSNGVSAIEATATYDPDELTITSLDEVDDGDFQISPTDDDGTITFRGFQADILNADGVTGTDVAFATATVEAKAGAPENAGISFTSAVVTEIEGGEAVEATPGFNNFTPGSGSSDGNGSDGNNSDGNGGAEETTSGNVEGEASLALTPKNAEPRVGSQFGVDLSLAATKSGASAFEIEINYTPGDLEFSSFTAGSDFRVQDSNAGGKLTLRGFQSDILSDSGIKGSNIDLGTIVFKSLKAGQTSIVIDNSSNVTLISSGTAKEVSPAIRSATVTAKAVQTGDNSNPTVPGSLTATAVDASNVRLNWRASTDASGIDRYVLSRKRQGAPKFDDFRDQVPGSRVAHLDRSVFAGVTYQYRLRAVDNQGNESGFSNVVTVTTPGAPTTPSNSTGTTIIIQNVDPGSGGTPDPGDDPIEEEDVQAVEDPADVFGSTGDGEPSPELINQTSTGSVSYKSATVDVTYNKIRRAFVQYGLFEEGLFNRTNEQTWDGNGVLSLEIPDLTPGTRYFYQVVAEDVDGNELRGEVNEVNTLGYRVSVTITDDAGGPLPLLAVTLFSDPIQSQTDQNGVAIFENVSPGDHTVDFNYNGEQISQSIVVEDTIVADTGVAPADQIFTVTAAIAGVTQTDNAPAEEESGGSGLIAFIIVLLVLAAIAVIVYLFIRRQQQPYGGGGGTPTPTYDAPVITPGPGSAPQDLNSVSGQYPAPGSVYDPNQPPR